MPNNLAHIVVYSWPIVVFIIFRLMRREQAIIVSILGGYLLLPEGVGIDPPILPTLDKTLIPALSAGVMCLFTSNAPTRRRTRVVNEPRVETETTSHSRYSHSGSGRGPRHRRQASATAEPRTRSRSPGMWIERALLFLLVATPFITVMQNSEPYAVGERLLPGLRPYDAFSMVLTAIVAILPYLIARCYLARPEQHVLLLSGLCVAGLLYSLPALFEIRMSPQLSSWIYGFLNQPFRNTIRGGGFRPTVFLHAGLWLAIFFAMTVIAAFSLWRHLGRFHWMIAGLWLFATLALSNSLGALLLAVLFVPIVMLFSARIHLMAASAAALIIILYPMLRGADLVPVYRVTELVRSVDADRAQSFEFRLQNEDVLLAHANAKPLAGWGGWGRSRVVEEETTVTDGAWIIIVGTSGWLGYIAIFGLLTMPIFLTTLRRRRLEASLATAGLCLILIINLIDMIPNATNTPVTWLVAGALAGRNSIGNRSP